MNKRIPALAIALLAAPALVAQTSTPAAFHVFGGWAYGRTDGNEYLTGTHAGAYDNLYLALNASTSPVAQLRLEAQAAVEIALGVQETHVEYAFGEWRFSDGLKVHAGRMPHPFGIYAEIFDVGTLRPFYALPQSVYGPAGNASESYDGAGVTGFRRLAGKWAVTYDLYGGQLEMPFADVDRQVFRDAAGDTLVVRHVLGAHATVDAPIDGVSFGLSAYRGKAQLGTRQAEAAARGAQAEFVSDGLSLRSELTTNDIAGEGEHAGYFEAAWHVTPRWQIAGRYDHVHEHGDHALDGRHVEVAAGLNYWFARHFVMKLSVHRVEGTHFALPDARSGTLRPRTHLMTLGTQFSF
jgi:hypothetical protein